MMSSKIMHIGRYFVGALLTIVIISCIVSITRWTSVETSIQERDFEESYDFDSRRQGEPQQNKSTSTKGELVKPKDPQVEKYLHLISAAQRKALSLLTSQSGWTVTKGTSEDQGIVYSHSTKEWGTVHKLVASIDVDAKILFDDMIQKSEDVPKWNPTLLKVEVVKKLDNFTEIAYSVSAPAAGGWVSSRDFVYLRHWEKVDGWYVTSSVSIHYPPIPDKDKFVRGVQGPTVIRVKATGPSKLRLEWLLNTDAKGSIPTYIVNQAKSGTLTTYLERLKDHARTLV